MKMIKLLLLFLPGYLFAQNETVALSVYFETDSSKLSTIATEKIEKAFNSRSASISNIDVIGYCDDRGSDSYNLKLAARRVESVIDYLAGNFSSEEFTELAIGELPLNKVDNVNEQRKNNRRVDISISFKEDIKIIVPQKAIVNDTIEKYRSYDILKDSLNVGDKLVFNNLIFYPGRHVLRESSFPVMDSIINSLLLHKKYEIEIQGHICCLAAGVYGRDMDTGQWNLSQARAEQVKRFLVKYGVAADRLTTIGKQSNFKTGKGDYYDRRVEIHITGIREEEVEN